MLVSLSKNKKYIVYYCNKNKEWIVKEYKKYKKEQEKIKKEKKNKDYYTMDLN